MSGLDAFINQTRSIQKPLFELNAHVKTTKLTENLMPHIEKHITEYTSPTIDRSKDDEGLAPGFIKLNKIYKVLEEFRGLDGSPKFRLKLDQRVMIAHMTTAILPFLFGADLEANRSVLEQRLKIKDFNEFLLIVAPRRAGKTTGLAAFVAAVLIAIDQLDAAVFSLGQQTSGNFAKMVVDFLQRHPKGLKLLGNPKTLQNAKEIRLIDPDNPLFVKRLRIFPDVSKVCSLFFLFTQNCSQLDQGTTFQTFKFCYFSSFVCTLYTQIDVSTR